MKQIADLHIHSRYSMATSKDGTPEMLDLWARKKWNHTTWNRRYDTSHLAAGVEGEADPCRTGTVPAERGICFAGGSTLSGKSTQVRTVR